MARPEFEDIASMVEGLNAESKRLDQASKSMLDAERQYRESTERINQELNATDFCDTSTSMLSGLEELNAMRRAQNQAPFDMIAELKAINERLDSAEKDSQKQTTENRIWQSIIIAIALLTLAATIFGVLK